MASNIYSLFSNIFSPIISPISLLPRYSHFKYSLFSNLFSVLFLSIFLLNLLAWWSPVGETFVPALSLVYVTNISVYFKRNSVYLPTIQWPCMLFAQCHFLHFRMLLFFSITSYPAEIVYFNSSNGELSNGVWLSTCIEIEMSIPLGAHASRRSIERGSSAITF